MFFLFETNNYHKALQFSWLPQQPCIVLNIKNVCKKTILDLVNFYLCLNIKRLKKNVWFVPHIFSCIYQASQRKIYGRLFCIKKLSKSPRDRLLICCSTLNSAFLVTIIALQKFIPGLAIFCFRITSLLEICKEICKESFSNHTERQLSNVSALFAVVPPVFQIQFQKFCS